MNTIEIVNLKCGGCASSIKSSLEKAGMENISVDISCQKISFDGDINRARKILASMGYPEKGSPEAESLFKKAKSYVSCAIGKMRNNK
jgi:copper chaperone